MGCPSGCQSAAPPQSLNRLARVRYLFTFPIIAEQVTFVFLRLRLVTVQICSRLTVLIHTNRYVYKSWKFTGWPMQLLPVKSAFRESF